MIGWLIRLNSPTFPGSMKTTKTFWTPFVPTVLILVVVGIPAAAPASLGHFPISQQPLGLLSSTGAVFTLPQRNWIFSKPDIQFELASPVWANADHLTSVFQVFALDNQGSPSRDLPRPDMGEEKLVGDLTIV